jgi:hypothetical protein
MKIPRSLFGAVLVTAFAAAAFAQQTPSGFHSVACIKVKPQDRVEFRKFTADTVHKLEQARANSGAITAWYMMRSVIPQGRSAECDFLSIVIYAGATPTTFSREQTEATLKEIGSSMTAQELNDRRDTLTSLVSNNLFRTRASVGEIKKGDYIVVHYQKVPNTRDWLANEVKVWQPFAGEMLKDGVRTGWSAIVQVMPTGSDLKYNAVNVDVYPSMEAVFKSDPQMQDRWKKVHPDMDFATTMQGLDKFRTTVFQGMLTVEDMVAKAK